MWSNSHKQFAKYRTKSLVKAATTNDSLLTTAHVQALSNPVSFTGFLKLFAENMFYNNKCHYLVVCIALTDQPQVTSHRYLTNASSNN